MKIEDLTLKTENDSIPWRIFTPEKATKDFCVLWLQGWTSSMNSHRAGVERMAQKTNIPFATLDYAGHGLHGVKIEDSTREQQHKEVIAIYDELKKQGYKKIICIGGSFGGYMAALLCGLRELEAVMLRAPAMYDDAEFSVPHKQTKRWENTDAYREERVNAAYVHDNMALEAVKKFNGMTYVVEHELDEQVPAIMPRTYFEAAKRGNYIIVPKTMHSPKLMPNPQPHFDYIEHWVIATIEAVKLLQGLA